MDVGTGYNRSYSEMAHLPPAQAAAAAAIAVPAEVAATAVCPPSSAVNRPLTRSRVQELNEQLEEVKQRRDHLGRESPILTALVIVGVVIMLFSLRMIPIYFPVFLPAFSVGLVIMTMSGVFLKIQDDALEAQQADIQRQISESSV